jgi:predicted transcriptional regulator
MATNPLSNLSRRERQIMDVLYRLGRATANEIIAELPDERHLSTVRTQLRLLEGKGHVRREGDGVRYVYMPAVSQKVARKSALKHLVDTFFEGSTASVISTLLTSERHRLSVDDAERLAALIEEAAEDARQSAARERTVAREPKNVRERKAPGGG